MSLSPSAMKSVHEYVYSRYRNRSKGKKEYYRCETKDEDEDENDDFANQGVMYHFAPISLKENSVDEPSPSKEYEGNISGLITPVISVSKTFNPYPQSKPAHSQEKSESVDRSPVLVLDLPSCFSDGQVSPRCDDISPKSKGSHVHFCDTEKTRKPHIPGTVVAMISPIVSKEMQLRKIKSDSSFQDSHHANVISVRKESLVSTHKDIDNADCRGLVHAWKVGNPLPLTYGQRPDSFARMKRWKNLLSDYWVTVASAHRRAIKSIAMAASGIHLLIISSIVIVSANVIFDEHHDEFIAMHFVSIMLVSFHSLILIFIDGMFVMTCACRIIASLDLTVSSMVSLAEIGFIESFSCEDHVIMLHHRYHFLFRIM
jgi:hypothetical protein